jgi:hypothetical protein
MQRLRSNRGGGQGILAIIAIICIAVAAFFIVKQTKKKDEGASGGVYYYCTNCEKEFVDTDQDPPIKCPYCNQLTGVYLRKCKCNKCSCVFRAYLLKWDPDVKRRRERRRQGENVPYEEGETELISEPDADYWVDSQSPDGIDILANISCPKCGASGEDIEPVFPEPKK